MTCTEQHDKPIIETMGDEIVIHLNGLECRGPAAHVLSDEAKREIAKLYWIIGMERIRKAVGEKKDAQPELTP